MKEEWSVFKQYLLCSKENETTKMKKIDSFNQTRQFYISVGKIIAIDKMINRVNSIMNRHNRV
jgi:hypothetical protein